MFYLTVGFFWITNWWIVYSTGNNCLHLWIICLLIPLFTEGEGDRMFSDTYPSYNLSTSSSTAEQTLGGSHGVQGLPGLTCQELQGGGRLNWQYLALLWPPTSPWLRLLCYFSRGRTINTFKLLLVRCNNVVVLWSSAIVRMFCIQLVKYISNFAVSISGP